MVVRAFICSLVTALMLAPGSNLAAAEETGPAALRNKTVVLTWSEYRVQKQQQTGAIRKSNVDSDFRIYVSSAGRLFSTFTRKNVGDGLGNESKLAPGGNTVTSGTGQGKRTARFEGNMFVAENKMRSGARRIQTEFDPSFTSCTLKVLYGKDGNAPLLHKAMDGRMYYIISTDVTVPTCAIKEGNHVRGD